MRSSTVVNSVSIGHALLPRARCTSWVEAAGVARITVPVFWTAARGTPVGFINPLLYGKPDAFHDITSGNNGTYAARQRLGCLHQAGRPYGPAIAAVFAADNAAVV
jgi:hypothetical protein